jgi:phosphoribosylanthranilate isomerase
MTKIKICGIKTLSDALAAIDAGADYLGFNFYPKSVRFLETDACSEITSILKREHPEIKLVGVFVNSPIDEIKHILETCSLDLAQLHGDETLEMFIALDGKAFKAFRGVPQHINGFARRDVPALLVDASVRGIYGGTGVTANWSAAAELAKHYPLLLAGGLTPDNVAEAVRKVKPWGVDIASGVESAPGVKDGSRMKAFVQAVRAESKVSRLWR